MQRYQIQVEYDGTNFVGWQYQKNGLSIQEIIQNAIFEFSGERVNVVGAACSPQQKASANSWQCFLPRFGTFCSIILDCIFILFALRNYSSDFY